MTSAELYELVKGHEDVWGETMQYEAVRGTYMFFEKKWGVASSSQAAELMLIALFALATECGVHEYPADHKSAIFAAYRATHRWPIGHGPNPLAALVNALEAMGKGVERGV